jgi:hypothetical protein
MYEQKHGKNEQIEQREKTGKALILGHIARGIDVDEKADAGDDQSHHQRQRIQQQRCFDLEFTHRDPGKKTAMRLKLAWRQDKAKDWNQHCQEGEQHRAWSHNTDNPATQPPAKEAIDDHAQQREQQQQPQ